MKARNIMRWNPAVVTPDQSVMVAAELMRYEEDACIPVVKDATTRQLVGVITSRDLATRCVARGHGHECSVGEHMTPLPLRTVDLDDDIGTMLSMMHDSRIRRLPVVSVDGVLHGIVTEGAVHEALAASDWLAHWRVKSANGSLRAKAKVS
jgi:IMP dehydrogenase